MLSHDSGQLRKPADGELALHQAGIQLADLAGDLGSGGAKHFCLMLDLYAILRWHSLKTVWTYMKQRPDPAASDYSSRVKREMRVPNYQAVKSRIHAYGLVVSDSGDLNPLDASSEGWRIIVPALMDESEQLAFLIQALIREIAKQSAPKRRTRAQFRFEIAALERLVSIRLGLADFASECELYPPTNLSRDELATSLSLIQSISQRVFQIVDA